MRLRRVIKWTVLLLLAAVGITAIVLYGFASRPPAAYQVTVLTPDQKTDTAGDFYRRIQEFGNAIERKHDGPFEWVITQDEFNDALAALDAIVDKAGQGKGAEVRKAMEKAGVADPAVAMDSGVLTLMIRSTRYDKVVSADIAMAVADDKLHVDLVGSRVGRMPFPVSFTKDLLAALRASAARPAGDSNSSPALPRFAGVSPEDMSSALTAVLSAIDGQPIDPQFIWPVNRVRVRIEGISIDKEKMKLTVRATR
ncbi:MAG: hypothetical protein ACE15C_03000 [Phycisphaerae bacterium]